MCLRSSISSTARVGCDAGTPISFARTRVTLEADGERGEPGVGVAAHGVLAALLRAVERAVGRALQLVALRRRERRDAGGHRHDGARDARGDVAADVERRGLVVAGKEDRKLVAAEPERLAAVPELRRDRDAPLVAGLVAELVVHALEVVDVDQAQREHPVLALGAVESGLEPFA